LNLFGWARKLGSEACVVRSKRILLVDDYPDALEIWGLYLRSLGYDVETADDGLKAVEQAHAHVPDIIVLDLELPGITGFEAATRLRQAPDTRHIPLIAATGYSHLRQLDQARAAGFDSIVVKPCEPSTLVAEIERLSADSDRQCERTSSEEVMAGTARSPVGRSGLSQKRHKWCIERQRHLNDEW
jgi:CheY-like chemotaxis protein